MTENEIADLNEAMRNQWGTDWYSGYYDVMAFPETIDEDWLKERICYLELKSVTLYYNGEVVTTQQWDDYYANLNLDGITPEVKYAVTENGSMWLRMNILDG